MTRLNEYQYSVVQAERISFIITPVGVGPRVTSAQNGDALTNTGTESELEFAFDITEGPNGRHRAQFVFSFLSEDADDARFDIIIKSADGTSDTPRSVRKADGFFDPMYTFEVNP